MVYCCMNCSGEIFCKCIFLSSLTKTNLYILYYSAFGQLDGINSSIRSGSQQLPLADAHIRFERVTEVRTKSSGCVEEVIWYSSFDIPPFLSSFISLSCQRTYFLNSSLSTSNTRWLTFFLTFPPFCRVNLHSKCYRRICLLYSGSRFCFYFCLSFLLQHNIKIIKQLLRSTVEESNLNRLSSSPAELKGSPPTVWTDKVEQIVMRSMSFSEFEMMSHPLILLTVVCNFNSYSSLTTFILIRIYLYS